MNVIQSALPVSMTGLASVLAAEQITALVPSWGFKTMTFYAQQLHAAAILAELYGNHETALAFRHLLHQELNKL